MRNSILLSTVAVPSSFPPTMHEGFFFFTSLHTLVHWFIDDSHSDRCEMILHCDFNCISLIISDIEHLFHVSIVHLYVLFEEVSIQVLCLFFNWIVYFLTAKLYEFFYKVWVLTPYQMSFWYVPHILMQL